MSDKESDDRRTIVMTLEGVENAVFKANEKFFDKVKKMCDDNVKIEMQAHLINENNFDKTMASKMYRIIDNYTDNKKALYVVGVPMVLLFVDSILSKMGVW